ncbi:hypothetical protein ND861_01545 [Leptospira sp. 2 VSF19]|uniref:DUF3347 domain-containing protein n=1 Tax=Leptospira soteropolitanensis TaxID=2950025 RepID=A0AAW5VEQ7_9LEPT|nr:hypothetical protein [Leptospira soteropolitanensis]MCW7491330.1 hypothetical protein [Leptospira soteropolitanensis]MCW7498915.1 hypothetical protein [Leptospira soteropolitanensis]MCW7521493.1 hypothetical protein [Leptospira soteropolitanensis]MCW7525018.1 hypothetical protein [Leptospira soteropolitanensis]MCW7528886.1 hypothetical protein [Leptospira soteropolitanensis]
MNSNSNSGKKNQNMNVFRISLIVLAVFALSCKEETVPFTLAHQNVAAKLLSENQILLEEYLKENPKPNWKIFSETLETMVASGHPKLKSWAEGLRPLLPASGSDLESSYEKISKIQEILIQIKTEVPNQSQYNRFYCPMVDKYWLMTGREVKNPYAPEMRDCGELLQ